MAKNTSNIDLVKPGVDEFYDVNIMNSNLDKIDSYTGEIKNKIYNGSIQNTNLQLGCNRIQIPEIPVSPKIEFTGFSYVNLLGRDGNCEDLSKWGIYNSTPTTDTVNKVFGNSSIKITISSSDGGNIFKSFANLNINTSKYYMLTAYVKNGNASTGIVLVKDGNGGGVPLATAHTIDNTKFTRVGILIQPSDLHASNALYPFVGGTSGQYAYVDGVMLNEITAAEYAAGLPACMAKYPYIESYTCLTNPYFENRRYNLVRNGNCEEGIAGWTQFTAGTSIVVEGNRFKVTAESTVGMGTKVKLKPNTNYFFSGNVTGGTSGGVICLMKTDYSEAIKFGAGTFNSASNTEAIVYLNNLTANGYCYYDSLMLVEGTTAPTEYKSCDLERFVVEGQFTSDDKVTIENGYVSGLLNWKHTAPLYGKDYNWEFNLAGESGLHLKRVCIPNEMSVFPNIVTTPVLADIGHVVVKYNGKILRGDVEPLIYEDTYLAHDGITGTNRFYISIPDADSGWVEPINPNNDEVKAFMNGWKAVVNTGGRYILWRNIVDNSYPSSAIKTTVTTGATNSHQVVTAGTGTKFKAGDLVSHFNSTGIYLRSVTVSAVSADAIDFTGSFASTTGDIFVKADNGTTDLSMLTWCKSNVAPGYKGYRLHYKLTNPEPITDTNVPVKDKIWDLVKGDNYVTVDSGIVLGEAGTPWYYSGGASWNINIADGKLGASGNQLQHMVETIFNIYKNGAYDDWMHLTGTSNPYGKDSMYTVPAKYDANATYTVDYQILKTLHTQTFGSLSLSYPQSIISALEGHSKALEQKQAKSSVLDYINDAGLYEELGDIQLNGRFINFSGDYVGLELLIYYSSKNTIPRISVDRLTVGYFPGNNTYIAITNSPQIVLTVAEITKTHARLAIQFTNMDTTIRNYLVNNGGYVRFSGIKVNCRGRI